MKKGSFTAALLLSAVLAGCAGTGEQSNAANAAQGVQQQQSEASKQQSEVSEETVKQTITSLVEHFGKKLQLVSLLAPEQTVRESMKEHYAEYISPSLLETWQSDPQDAPGRLTSSPWPDRIEVVSVNPISKDAYKVEGEIIEVTSMEQNSSDGNEIRRAIILEVRNIEGRWLIDAAELEPYENGDEADSVVFENAQYGFRFPLPASWKGYTIVEDKWEGLSSEESQSGKVTASGPVISIRHPEWTAQEPRQDIPILVFTLDQWNSLQEEKFHIGAAPIGPSELGRNDKYVFALPARYNYAFPKGYEEVEEILSKNPLQPIEAN